jgi:hypothetical protein
MMVIVTRFSKEYSAQFQEDRTICVAFVLDRHGEIVESASVSCAERTKRMAELEDDAILALWAKNPRYADLPIGGA